MKQSHVSLVLLLAALLAESVAGQPPVQATPAPALAHATGKATVTQPANLILIAFERVFEGKDFAALWPESQEFRTNLLAGLKELGDQASLRIVTDIAQTQPPRLLAHGAIVINFGPLLSQPDGEYALAGALDGVSALCVRLGATTGAVTYELADTASIQQEAVRQATENAYLPADAVARALRADLYTVDEVRVTSLEITSGTAELSATNPTPSGREVSCSAIVDVSYLLADRP